MKKIIGIIGSPRKLGNCEIMAKEISMHLSVPHELKLLRLSDFNILPCKGCYKCLGKKERCVLDDDFNLVLDSIVDADALILVVPTYFLGANSCLKRFIDRGLAFYAFADKVWGKPAVGVGIAGIKGKEGSTLLDIENFFRVILADNKYSTIVYGALPGEVFIDGKNKNIAAGMASALFGSSLQKKVTCCPVCGGDTFRFLGDNNVRCMLCSNSGTYVVRENNIVFEIDKSDHEFCSSSEEALKHKEWLKGMVARFILQRNDLKKIRQAYMDEWVWIKP